MCPSYTTRSKGSVFLKPQLYFQINKASQFIHPILECVTFGCLPAFPSLICSMSNWTPSCGLFLPSCWCANPYSASCFCFRLFLRFKHWLSIVTLSFCFLILVSQGSFWKVVSCSGPRTSKHNQRVTGMLWRNSKWRSEWRKVTEDS